MQRQAIVKTSISLSSSHCSSIPSLHSRIPSQGMAIILRSYPGRRSSRHSMVAILGKVCLHNSKPSSSPYKHWKTPSQVSTVMSKSTYNTSIDHSFNIIDLNTFLDTTFAYFAKVCIFSLATVFKVTCIWTLVFIKALKYGSVA